MANNLPSAIYASINGPLDVRTSGVTADLERFDGTIADSSGVPRDKTYPGALFYNKSTKELLIRDSDNGVWAKVYDPAGGSGSGGGKYRVGTEVERSALIDNLEADTPGSSVGLIFYAIDLNELAIHREIPPGSGNLGWVPVGDSGLPSGFVFYCYGNQQDMVDLAASTGVDNAGNPTDSTFNGLLFYHTVDKTLYVRHEQTWGALYPPAARPVGQWAAEPLMLTGGEDVQLKWGGIHLDSGVPMFTLGDNIYTAEATFWSNGITYAVLENTPGMYQLTVNLLLKNYTSAVTVQILKFDADTPNEPAAIVAVFQSNPNHPAAFTSTLHGSTLCNLTNRHTLGVQLQSQGSCQIVSTANGESFFGMVKVD